MSLLENIKSPNSHTRSLVKAFTWRVFSTVFTTIIAYFVTQEIQIALLIGGVEFLVKFAIYYSHERLWNKIK